MNLVFRNLAKLTPSVSCSFHRCFCILHLHNHVYGLKNVFISSCVSDTKTGSYCIYKIILGNGDALPCCAPRSFLI